MRSHKFIFILIMTICFSLNLWSQKKEEDDAKDPKAALLKKTYSGKQDFEWEKTQAKVIAAKGKLEAQLSLLQVLMEQKSKLSGQALTDKIEELKTEHLRLKTIKAEYEQLKSEFFTKYPDRGIKEVRLYKRTEKKTLKSAEDLGIDGRINKVHKKIIRQYTNQDSENKIIDPKEPVLHQNKADDSTKTKEKEITDQLELKK